MVCVTRQGPGSTVLTELVVETESRLGTGEDGDNMEDEMVSCGTDGEGRLPAMQGVLPCLPLEGIWGCFQTPQKHPCQWTQLFFPFRDEKTETF